MAAPGPLWWLQGRCGRCGGSRAAVVAPGGRGSRCGRCGGSRAAVGAVVPPGPLWCLQGRCGASRAAVVPPGPLWPGCWPSAPSSSIPAASISSRGGVAGLAPSIPAASISSRGGVAGLAPSIPAASISSRGGVAGPPLARERERSLSLRKRRAALMSAPVGGWPLASSRRPPGRRSAPGARGGARRGRL